MEPIKILAISPYPGMVPRLQAIAAAYENVELTINVGDLAKGLEMAQKGFHANFDVILSRGGTAQLLEQAVSLPVVEIGTSVYDVLCTLRQANAKGSDVAVVGYSNITQDMGLLKELLPYKISVFPIDSPQQVVPTLQYLRGKGYTQLLCDMVTYTTAREMDFQAFLITSSDESIRAAFEKALFFCSAGRQLRAENHFLRQLLQRQLSQAVVFTRDGKLFFSTLGDEDTDVLSLFRERIAQVSEEGQSKFLVQHKGLLYHIRALCIAADGQQYVAFSFCVTTPPAAGDKYGIHYCSRKELEQECRQSFYQTLGTVARYKRAVQQAAAGREPVFLLGEAGTGKEYLARTLYLRGPRADHPFVQIDCNLLNQKTWNYLLNHHNSPLCDIGSTLYLQNLDALDPGQWRQLLAFLLDGRTARRNRMIFSATGTGAGAQAFLHDFLNRLSCFPIALAPLRTQPEQVDTAFDLYLNRCAMDTGKQLTGIDPEALALLRQYPWPQNWLQFRRVMERLTTLADGPRVTLANVREALQPELSFAQPDTGTGSPYALDLSKPLAQIDREIALLVLERCGDNQSRAAQSLGISRTTLWRMLKN